ncbi:MAG: thiamine diphosphokinase [Flavobacteriaceae bacterium]|nr:thiamine diphosphokinase [Flavobacteriaceae bacterium]
MISKNAFLLLNGSRPKTLPDLSKYAIICATDGAYKLLKEKSITPHFISGDFDSISEIPKDIEVIHTPNQEFTDFEKAIKILLNMGITNVHVYGASGLSQDHFLGNLHVAIVFKNKIQITFFDDYQYYFLAKQTEKIKVKKGNIVSLVPVVETKNIITKGLEYELENEDLVFGKRVGIRNKATQNEFEICFSEGELFIFIEHE